MSCQPLYLLSPNGPEPSGPAVIPAAETCTEPEPQNVPRAVCRHIACAEGAYSVAQWLIESGVDPNPRDRHDRTPLEVGSSNSCSMQCAAAAAADPELARVHN